MRSLLAAVVEEELYLLAAVLGAWQRRCSARGSGARTLGEWWRCSACGGPPRWRPRLFSPAAAPEPEQEVLGTRLLFEFYIRDSIAFLFYIQGPDCFLCLYGMAQVTQATKQSISCIFSQHMRANKHTPKISNQLV
jgi:hypothetical protein